MHILNTKHLSWLWYSLLMLLLIVIPIHSQEYCTESGVERFAGKVGDYNYELWNQYGQGTGCMTVGSEGSFSGYWSGIENYLARRGYKYDETQTHQEIGAFTTTFDCTYNPSSATGNSYLSVYGWTVDPMIEYYIVEDWRNWIPSMSQESQFIDTIHIDGSIYDIYQATRTEQPSIKGTATFQQYFSIRRNKRTSGTIHISEHFKKWESLGMPMGKMYEVAFVVEGYQSSGEFDFKQLEINIDNSQLSLTPSMLYISPIKVLQIPHTQTLHISLDPALQKPTIQVYNAQGEQLHSRNHQHSTQVSDLIPGLYVVKANTFNQSYTAKIMVK